MTPYRQPYSPGQALRLDLYISFETRFRLELAPAVLTLPASQIAKDRGSFDSFSGKIQIQA